jgi:hypothetical protein
MDSLLAASALHHKMLEFSLRKAGLVVVAAASAAGLAIWRRLYMTQRVRLTALVNGDKISP